MVPPRYNFAKNIIVLIILIGEWYGTIGGPIIETNLAGVSICPRIVTREEWKARKVTGYQPLKYSPTPYVVIHHGGIPRYCFDEESCAAIVRSYQRFHIDDRGWIDIGYSFVIGEDGNVYEGRGWDYVGAHAPGYNTQSVGISIIGDFTNRMPNDAALEALNSLIACGVSLGKISKEYKVIGHRQAKSTECPGETFYQYVKELPNWTSHPKPVYQQPLAEVILVNDDKNV